MCKFNKICVCDKGNVKLCCIKLQNKSIMTNEIKQERERREPIM